MKLQEDKSLKNLDDDIFYSLPDEGDENSPTPTPARSTKRQKQTNKRKCKKSRSPFSLFFKLLTMPVEGWKELKRSHISSSEYGWKCFYPLVLMAALSKLAQLFFNQDIETSDIITDIVITFMTLLLANFITTLCCEWIGGEKMREQMRTDFGRNFIMSIIGSLAFALILWELIPMLNPIVSFLPLYTIYLIVRGVKYLRLPKQINNKAILTFTVLCIGIPIILYLIFYALV